MACRRPRRSTSSGAPFSLWARHYNPLRVTYLAPTHAPIPMEKERASERERMVPMNPVRSTTRCPQGSRELHAESPLAGGRPHALLTLPANPVLQLATATG